MKDERKEKKKNIIQKKNIPIFYGFSSFVIFIKKKNTRCGYYKFLKKKFHSRKNCMTTKIT